jgi:sec-independent protein translocase protein TatC
VILRPIGHQDRLSVVGHLDELRTRMIVSLVAVAVAFGFCFWQNHRLLQLIDEPLTQQTRHQVLNGHGPLGATYAVAQSARDIAVQLHVVVGALRDERRAPRLQARLAPIDASLHRDIRRLAQPPADRPVTLGIGEPFTTTVGVSFVFALILALPALLVQAYAFLMPALQPAQRQRLRPLLLAAPLLFVTGVASGYFIVLPAAVRFFQSFNGAQFNVLVQASPYYKFAATTLLATGLMFEVPVVILAVTRAGLISPRQLRRNRRYAIAAGALVAAALPGDAVTMLLEAVPIYLLFEVSVVIATFAEGRESGRTWRRSARAT